MERPLAKLLAWLLATCLLLPLTAAALNRGHASDYTVQHWDMRHGLPHNMVNGITQDGDGFIWVTTWEGAARFNGRSFTPFDDSNIPGLQTRSFRNAVTDTQGRVIFGAPQTGLWRQERGHWQPLTGHPRLSLLLLRARNGDIWVGTEGGLFRLDNQGQLHPGPKVSSSSRSSWVTAIAELDNGYLLLAADDVLFEVNPQTLQARQLELDVRHIGTIFNLLHTRQGETFLAPQRGLYQKTDTGLVAVPAFEKLRISAMLEDRRGNIWVSTAERGLLRWRGDMLEAVGEQEGLTGHSTPALFEDNEGHLWVGTTDGLFLIARSTAKSLDTRHGLDNKNVRTVLHARDDSIWIGTSAGLNRWKQGQITTLDSLWGKDAYSSVLALAEAADGIWVGTYERGILLLDENGKPKKAVDRTSGLSSNRIRSLLVDGEDLWIGSHGGLSRLDKAGAVHHYGAEYGLEEGFITVIHKDPQGTLWLGGSQGLCVLPQSRQKGRCYNRQSDPQLPAQTVFDFLEMPGDEMLIASDHGILRWDGHTFRSYGKAHGLPNQSLFRLLPDRQGFLWVSSNNGVFRIDPKQLDEIDQGKRSQLSLMHFTQDSGMPSSQANGNSFPAADMDADGNFWVATGAGVAIINTQIPTHITQVKVPLVIEQLLVDGIEHSAWQPATLPATDTKRIVIRYAGLNHRRIQELRYRYRLLGFDDSWIEAGNGTEAVFTNLPPGNFVFEVQAMAPPLDWKQVPASNQAALQLTLTPAWWQRRTVQLGALLLGGLALLALLRLREHNLHKGREKLEKQVKIRTRELNEKNQALQEASQVQSQLMQRLEFLAGQDELTSLPNRRSARKHMEALCQLQAIRLAMIDLDHFKHINDRYGHETGDRALIVFARLLQQHAGHLENCARLGGEEFALLIPDADHDSALARCQSLCEQMAATPIHAVNGEILYCTISIGLSGPSREPHQLLHEADEALYRAKNAGRNRVCIAD
ncbi:MAG: diguanylate cyclase [Pseudomonadota bacterium]|nr:diguanylate cyclase [Pseudomonadota bacterium]